jgi:NADPH:quinone reductase-like Zn-dependent oxidoreductase
MKTAQINAYGGPEVIEINETQKPATEKGKVLVKVYASSVNPFDVKLVQGMMQKMIPLQFPYTIGGDIAGVVSEISEGVEGFSVGNKVYGSANALLGATGAFAEYTLVSPDTIAIMPANVDFTQGATLVLAGVSAVQAIEEHFKLAAGQKILIHGGAGGIGTIAIQIAKKLGAYVATTATHENAEYVKKLGADEVIDYTTQKFSEVLSDYDAVFDTVGGETYTQSFGVLRKGGILVSMIAPHNQELADIFGVTAITQATKVTTKHLDMLTKYVEGGAVKPYIDKIYTLDNIKEAFKEQASGVVKGKIAIEVQNN